MNRKIIFVICLVFISAVFSKKSDFVSADEIKKMKPRDQKRLLGKSLVIKQEPYNPEEIYQLKTLYEFSYHALDL